MRPRFSATSCCAIDKPSPVPLGFVLKNGVQDPPDDGRRDAGAVVGDLEADRGRRVGRASLGALSDGAERDPSRRHHRRVERVVEQDDEHLDELPFVDVDGRQVPSSTSILISPPIARVRGKSAASAADTICQGRCS